MTHVSIRLLHNRSQPRATLRQSYTNPLRSALARWLRWLPTALKRNRRRRLSRRQRANHRLRDLSDHQLKDIGLTRDQLGHHDQHWGSGSAFSESEQLHKGLRDLQYDLLRHSKMDP